ncbi:MAG: hypothetical protein ABWZ80_03810 [Beijerinckiaceae bacterium]
MSHPTLPPFRPAREAGTQTMSTEALVRVAALIVILAALASALAARFSAAEDSGFVAASSIAAPTSDEHGDAAPLRYAPARDLWGFF